MILKDLRLNGHKKSFFQKHGRNDVGKIDRIEDKTFCILNNRAHGDVLASLSLARQLKERGASTISLGVAWRKDLSLFRHCPDIDFIFTMSHSWLKQPNPNLIYTTSDYVINQNDYDHREGVSFYENRIIDGGINLETVEDFRPRVKLGLNAMEIVKEKLLPAWGIKPGEFIVFHPQAFHRERCLNIDCAYDLANTKSIRKIVVGRDYYPLQSEVENYVSFAQRNSMDLTGCLVELSAGFVGVCSVWSHVAFSFNKPCYIFYSDTRPEQIFGKHHSKLSFEKYGRGNPKGITISNHEKWLKWAKEITPKGVCASV